MIVARPSADGPVLPGQSRTPGHPRMAWVRDWPRTDPTKIDVVAVELENGSKLIILQPLQDLLHRKPENTGSYSALDNTFHV